MAMVGGHRGGDVQGEMVAARAVRELVEGELPIAQGHRHGLAGAGVDIGEGVVG
jgi:hypothetical protein